MFVSATFYRLAVDLYWTTPVPFHVHSKSKPWSQIGLLVIVKLSIEKLIDKLSWVYH